MRLCHSYETLGEYVPGTWSASRALVGRRKIVPQGGSLRRQTLFTPSSVRTGLTQVCFHTAAGATRQSNSVASVSPADDLGLIPLVSIKIGLDNCGPL